MPNITESTSFHSSLKSGEQFDQEKNVLKVCNHLNVPFSKTLFLEKLISVQRYNC